MEREEQSFEESEDRKEGVLDVTFFHLGKT